MNFTFSSEARMNELIAKANKAMAKLSLGVVTVASVTPRKVHTTDTTHLVYDADLLVPASLVQIADQTVVARVETIEGLNMITRLGSYTGNLDQYRTAAIECQHCGYKRNRKGSWVVVKDGQTIQIGDTCVDLYFGIDVERILRTSQSVFGILGSDDSYGTRYEPVQEFVTTCAFIAATEGFVTKKQADERDSQSTASKAFYLTGSCPQDSVAAADWRAGNAVVSEWAKSQGNVYEAVLDYWMGRDENLSEFEHNCRVAVMAQSLKWSGIVAYATKMYIDAVNRAKQPAAPKATSEWIGTAGERTSFGTVVVKSIYSFETAYGTITMVVFVQDGNLIVWKASSNPGLTVGESYSLKGTIKKHDDYKGTKQTIVTRCSIG